MRLAAQTKGGFYPAYHQAVAHAVQYLRPPTRQLDRTKRIVERVRQAIQAGNFYPNPSPINCSTCPYRGRCQAWTG